MPVRCWECSKIFSSISSVNKHARNVHKIKENIIKEYDKNANICKCLEGCNVSYKTIVDLIAHLKDVHNIDINVRTLQFKKFTDFEIWLSLEQKTKNIRYKRCRGSIKNVIKSTQKSYYDCFRSGMVRIKDEAARKRKLKKQGSIRINSYCTSRIILHRRLDTDVCTATYYETHYGHENDTVHLKLSEEVKKTVAHQLEEERSSNEILYPLKSSDEALDEIDLLIRKKDISNIKNSPSFIPEEKMTLSEHNYSQYINNKSESDVKFTSDHLSEENDSLLSSIVSNSDDSERTKNIEDCLKRKIRSLLIEFISDLEKHPYQIEQLNLIYEQLKMANNLCLGSSIIQNGTSTVTKKITVSEKNDSASQVFLCDNNKKIKLHNLDGAVETIKIIYTDE